MKKLSLLLFAASFIVYACNNEKKDSSEKTPGADTTASGDKTATDPCAGYIADKNQPPMDSATMAAWMAASTPGDMHKMLASADGDWDMDVTQWMDPAAPPTTSKATCSNKMILGGRYQMSDHTGCFGGMPFGGLSIVGYDNVRKVFNSAWMDNMGTAVMNLEGTYDPATKTIKFSGDCTNPMGGGMMKIREEFTMTDNDNQKMTMWGPDMKGKEFKMMEITFKRKK